MQIDEATPLAATLNGLLQQGFETKASIADDEAGVMAASTASLSSVSPDIFLIKSYGENDAGVHPTVSISYLYFSKTLHKVLTLGDIFSSDAWRNIANQLTTVDLKKRGLEPILEPGEVFESMQLSEPFHFELNSKSSFTLSNSFLSYAERADDSVELPWSAFSSTLTPFAKQLISSLP